MEKQKRWQFFLILAVIFLTVYNILPTVFFYTKPLKQPINEKRATAVAEQMTSRVNSLEKESLSWLKSYCQLLQIKPQSIKFDQNTPEFVTLVFKEKKDAKLFKEHIDRAGNLISFVPAQLGLYDSSDKTVVVQRKIPVHFDPGSLKKSFQFSQKFDANGQPTDLYRALVTDRVLELGSALTEASFSALSSRLDPNGTLSLKGLSPFIEQVSVDWKNGKIVLKPYEKDSQELYNAIATASRISGETILPAQDRYEISLSDLQNSKSFLAMRLGNIAHKEASQIKETLLKTWHPKHPDLVPTSFPVWDYETYQGLPADQKRLGLLVYAPVIDSKVPDKGFKMSSIYVVAKGADRILQAMQAAPESEEARQFITDFTELQKILQKNGFFGYRSPENAADFVFEQENYYQTVLKATRENFAVHGTKRYAILEFTDVEQRILTENKIDNRIHEDLLKWRDDYRAAELNIKGVSRFDVPAPTQNAFLSNLKLSALKYFRGDDRKVLRWGLDLSGGKTVQIELRDHNNRVVKDPIDIKEGMNELYARVNKLGVSEVNIRQEGNAITLDFPGSQGLSAAELVKSSSMFFHVVNEKFSNGNEAVNRFLQDVWNEAVITNKKEPEQINLIAWKQIHGDSMDENVVQPRSEAAKTLVEQGFKLASPSDMNVSSAFETTLSKIAVMRGENFADWHGQTHPLMIVFRNFALEGANLENVHASYDPSKGNYLSFGVKGSYTTKLGQKMDPRSDISTWTTAFSKEKQEGKGWRMAVILNGTIISAPTLDSPLRDSAMISGSFTQREINQLEADLKAGSLTFTPHILSEKNVSPELGSHEKNLGIFATFVALALVIITMTSYYKFAGMVASIALFFNLLIMWATLQNLGAAMTLAGLAGIILTMGMAVDANVLVFERIKEEFAITGRIGSAINAGYKKAFSAIVDSNLTTIIAALILLHFDSGPIKGFAVTLIIGIVSSMFTSLFMTHFFFAGWVKNPEHKELKMLHLIKPSSFNFLKQTKKTLLLTTLVILVGGFFLVSQRHTILGMDFTGGYAVTLQLENGNREKVEAALIKQGIKPQDLQIRELSSSNNVRIFLKDIPATETSKSQWVVNALQTSGVKIDPYSLENVDKNWTDVSGQLSDTMRTNAMIGLGIALLCILIYITFRFEFAYALSATLCLAHDVVFTVCVLGILNALKVPVQIDLNTVAALMTIVGYSLNDTIIIFDRIREDLKTAGKISLSTTINHALNVTLSRTTLTSGTTLLVLIPLIALGGSTVFGFALVMAIGVIFGTLSSLFIAAPLMQYFYEKQLKRNHHPDILIKE